MVVTTVACVCWNFKKVAINNNSLNFLLIIKKCNFDHKKKCNNNNKYRRLHCQYTGDNLLDFFNKTFIILISIQRHYVIKIILSNLSCKVKIIYRNKVIFPASVTVIIIIIIIIMSHITIISIVPPSSF